jgi:hypothetical protein
MATVGTTRAPHARLPHAGALAAEIFGSGITCGMLGGVVMAVATMAYTASIGEGFWAPMKFIAAAFLGVNALVGGAGVVLVGLALHLVVSAAWGILYALVARRDALPGPSLVLGLVASVIILVVMSFIVMPICDPTMWARVNLMWGMWIVAHLLFGLALALVPTLRRGIGDEVSHLDDEPA